MSVTTWTTTDVSGGLGARADRHTGFNA